MPLSAEVRRARRQEQREQRQAAATEHPDAAAAIQHPSGIHPRPRGRAPAGHRWNELTGTWCRMDATESRARAGPRPTEPARSEPDVDTPGLDAILSPPHR